jgi:hypothetical protein
MFANPLPLIGINARYCLGRPTDACDPMPRIRKSRHDGGLGPLATIFAEFAKLHGF